MAPKRGKDNRHFPERARAWGFNGTGIVFNPSATGKGSSAYLWEWEPPWILGEFYGQSHGDTLWGVDDEVPVADVNLDLLRQTPNTWPFFHDRRPEMYAPGLLRVEQEGKGQGSLRVAEGDGIAAHPVPPRR